MSDTQVSKLRTIIEELTERTAQHMLNMKIAPELTADLVSNAEDDAEQALKSLMLDLAKSSTAAQTGVISLKVFEQKVDAL